MGRSKSKKNLKKIEERLFFKVSSSSLLKLASLLILKGSGHWAGVQDGSKSSRSEVLPNRGWPHHTAPQPNISHHWSCLWSLWRGKWIRPQAGRCDDNGKGGKPGQSLEKRGECRAAQWVTGENLYPQKDKLCKCDCFWPPTCFTHEPSWRTRCCSGWEKKAGVDPRRGNGQRGEVSCLDS